MKETIPLCCVRGGRLAQRSRERIRHHHGDANVTAIAACPRAAHGAPWVGAEAAGSSSSRQGKTSAPVPPVYLVWCRESGVLQGGAVCGLWAVLF